MSVQAMTWAWEQELPMGPKAVLVAIANHADGEGLCYPGQARLARMVGCNERSIRNFVRVLEDAGLIERVQRRRKDGSRTSDEYRLIGLQPTRHAGSQPAPRAGSQAAPHAGREDEPTGTTFRTNRHDVPPLPAPHAGHERSEEPSVEPSEENQARERARTPKFDPLTVELPQHVDPQAWAEFVEHRREIRKRLTPTATKRLLADLANHPAEATGALRKSVKNSWTGVFFDDGKETRPTKPADDFRPEKYVPTSADDLLSPTKGTHR